MTSEPPLIIKPVASEGYIRGRKPTPPRSLPHGCVFSQKDKRYILVKEEGWYVVYRNGAFVTELRSYELGRDFVMGANSV